MPTLTPGQTLDRYVIVKFLANGGMGEVYHARHKVMGSDVALKLVFRPLIQEPGTVERFLREVQAVAKLNHPHIVKVFNAGEAGGEYFMALEYLPSGSLAAELRALHEARQRMPIPKAVEITRQIALALDYAHRMGFSHRDVKPGNVLIRSATEYVLTDFGIVLDETAARMTNKGWGMGTPAYMPPEQWNGNAVPQSDIYALGITLYEMLVGEVPFRATAPSALMVKHMTEPPPRVLVSRPDAPPGLQNVLDIALAKKPLDRYQTGADFARALGQVTAPSAPAGRGVSRRMVIGLVGGAGALGLGSLVVGELLKQSPPASPTPVPSAAPTRPTSTQPSAPTAAQAATAAPTVRQSATPARDRATVSLAQGVDIDFVRVPAGDFIMGTTDGWENEKPQSRLTLPEFWIGRAHVTVAQFAAFVKAIAYKTQAEKDGKSFSWTKSGYAEVAGADWSHPKGPASDTKGKEDHPVVHVSWDDANAFCAWAAKTAGKAMRLPSEAEWEKAARGTDGRKYPWGEVPPTAALTNFNLNIGTTTPVAKYSPGGDSPYGCVDMAGNAFQWVNSLHKPYPYLASDGRESASDRGSRVLRGGGFNDYDYGVRAVFRNFGPPSNPYENFGFRVCVSSI